MLQMEHSAILLTCNKLQVVIKTFVFLFFFEWWFYTGFTACNKVKIVHCIWGSQVIISIKHCISSSDQDQDSLLMKRQN